MTKEEYINELRARISHLPREEQESAMSYYIEYLQDADDKTMEEIIAELGTPQDVAERIIAECVQSRREGTQSGTEKGCLIGLLAALTSPIWFPLAIAAVAVVFSLLLVAVILLVVFGGLSFLLFGVGIWAIFVDVASGILLLGTSCVFVGITTLIILLFSAMGSLMKGLIHMIRRRRNQQ